MHIAAQFAIQTINMLSILLYEALCNTFFLRQKEIRRTKSFHCSRDSVAHGLDLPLYHFAQCGHRRGSDSTQSRVGKARRLAPVHVATQQDGMRYLIGILFALFLEFGLLTIWVFDQPACVPDHLIIMPITIREMLN